MKTTGEKELKVTLGWERRLPIRFGTLYHKADQSGRNAERLRCIRRRKEMP